MSTDERSPVAAAWLARVPGRHHPLVRAYVDRTIAQGARTPAEVLVRLEVLLGQKQQWSTVPATRALIDALLVSLRTDRHGALAYAQSVLDVEAHA